jgi:hypothetical protein
MQLQLWLDLTVNNGLELFLVVLISVGGRWARPFISENEWSDQIEMFVDFVVLCQVWVTCPLVFLSVWVGSDYFSAKLKGAVMFVVLAIMAVGLLKLTNWKRTGFFSRRLSTRVYFKGIPIAFLFGKIYLELYLKHSQQLGELPVTG